MSEKAIFGGGCFWCTEAVFKSIKGVVVVKPGYCGGHVTAPTYEAICGGQTGHIEVIDIEYEPEQVLFEALLEVFFATHDPTTPGRQGNDVGPQYQSVIFYQNAQQHEQAERFISMLNASGRFARPVCTQLLPAQTFWVAENYHHDYFIRNPNQGYCQMIVAPKVGKFKKEFPDLLVS
jgi:peptide-methionine (S)-S-oxide reductase